GNFTGMSYLAFELVGKRVELLKEWLPDTKRIAVLARPQHPGVHLERAATEAVVVFPASAMFEVSERVANFARDAKLPSVSGWYPFAQKGLLMTYGPNVR